MMIVEVDRERIDALLPLVQADQMGIDPDSGQWLAACDDRGTPIGVARVTEIGPSRTIDDVWVAPEHRRRGIARALIAHAQRPLWLICDEDMIEFYKRLGFQLMRAGDFPQALAALYASRGEWPRSADHTHFAMLLEDPES